MSAYELIKFDEEGPAVRDCISSNPVDQESPFCCHLDASSDTEIEDKLLKHSLCVCKLEDGTSRYPCL